ncbi:LysR substrate-binding domain-containing protein [Lautropia mirabilis]
MTVPPTQAGEQLHQRLAPLFDDIDNEVNALSELRDTLRGRLRINGTEHVLELLWPKFMRFMQAYPEVELELVGEMRFVDIVAERFDAGIRLGDDVERDMIAVRVTPDMQMCVVASPVYPGLKRLPQTPAGLMEHPCVNRSLPAGGVLAWEFRDPSDGRLVKVRPQGRFASSRGLLLPAALAGLGLLWIPREVVADRLARGELIEVLADWAISYPGYHLYYPNRRADSRLFQALVNPNRRADSRLFRALVKHLRVA